MRLPALLTSMVAALAFAPAAMAQEEAQTQQTPHGGAEYGATPPSEQRVIVPGSKAVRMDNGFAAAPADAPPAVQEAIFAANEIVGKPYRYGGGHRSFKDTGYDCSGTISYALKGAGVLDSPLDSSSFMRWGELVTFSASVNAVWRTSMEIGVRVTAERPGQTEPHHTNTAYFTMVALDEDGQPCQVPPLLVETAAERRREREAQTRRRNRLAEREQIVRERG